MRTLTILLLAFASSAYGQSGTLNIENVKTMPVNGEIIGTHILIQISPVMPDSMIVTDKDLFISVTGWNLLRYELEVYRIKKNYHCEYKCVDLRIINRGKTTDYTFEQFRKILWE